MKKPLTIALAAILLLQMFSLAWAWEIERPSDVIGINERTESAYTNGEASVGLGVAIGKYLENFEDYGGLDTVNLNVSMTANSRMGITYNYNWQDLWWIPEDELWYRNDMVGVGDDWGAWIDFPSKDGYPFYFRFYGGLGSAEYERVWVSSNGFIAFDNSNSTSPNPYDIPYPTKPNALIAGIWTDLRIDSSASIITGQWAIFSHYYFVIIWKNALHKASGKRLTFQIILEDAPQYYPADRRYGQSRIWISYYSVSSINTNFAVGIEDQQGRKGSGGLCSGDSLAYFNGYTLEFYRYASSYFLKRLTLTFEDDNPDTEFDIKEDWRLIRGYNIRWNWDQPSQPDGTYMFATALTGTATLLISGLSPAGGWVAAAGFIVDTVLVGLDWAEYLAYRQYSGRQVEVFDRDDYLEQQANATALTYDYVVDASLSLIVHWILKTPNDMGSHSLTVTAKLEYYEYTITGEIIEKDPITTMVDLKIGPDDNKSFDTADEKSEGWHYRLYIGGYDMDDYYKIYVRQGCVIYVYVELTSEPDPDIDLYLYSPGRVQKAHKTLADPSDYTDLSFTADASGYWFIRIHSFGDYGFYKFYIDVYRPGGGGGCPYIYAWNGSQYVVDNNLLPASETSNGTDVEDYYKLEQTLTPLYEGNKFSLYSLLIKEFENEHSYLDYAQLLAVDHSLDVNVAVTQDGQILTYKDPVPPISAINSLGENALTPLYLTDGNYYEGFEGDYLILNFGNVSSENAKLVLRTDLPLKRSIYIQVQDSAGNWIDVATIIPRTYWATDIIDIPNYSPNSNIELKVRLYFTASHKIDYVGLDTTKQAEFKIHKAHLISAIHSSEEPVTAKLLRDDNIYAELLPEQEIKLTFITHKQQPGSARTFIVYIEGHYYTLTDED